ncbi:hypothetical protein D3C72_2375180 [compost metagenome]
MGKCAGTRPRASASRTNAGKGTGLRRAAVPSTAAIWYSMIACPPLGAMRTIHRAEAPIEAWAHGSTWTSSGAWKKRIRA